MREPNLSSDGLLASPAAEELPDGLLGGVGASPELGHVAAVVLPQRLPERPHHLPRRLQVRLGQHLPRLGPLVRVKYRLDRPDHPLPLAAAAFLRRPGAPRRAGAHDDDGGGQQRPPRRHRQPRSACTVCDTHNHAGIRVKLWINRERRKSKAAAISYGCAAAAACSRRLSAASATAKAATNSSSTGWPSATWGHEEEETALHACDATPAATCTRGAIGGGGRDGRGGRGEIGGELEHEHSHLISYLQVASARRSRREAMRVGETWEFGARRRPGPRGISLANWVGFSLEAQNLLEMGRRSKFSLARKYAKSATPKKYYPNMKNSLILCVSVRSLKFEVWTQGIQGDSTKSAIGPT